MADEHVPAWLHADREFVQAAGRADRTGPHADRVPRGSRRPASSGQRGLFDRRGDGHFARQPAGGVSAVLLLQARRRSLGAEDVLVRRAAARRAMRRASRTSGTEVYLSLVDLGFEAVGAGRLDARRRDHVPEPRSAVSARVAAGSVGPAFDDRGAGVADRDRQRRPHAHTPPRAETRRRLAVDFAPLAEPSVVGRLRRTAPTRCGKSSNCTTSPTPPKPAR